MQRAGGMNADALLQRIDGAAVGTMRRPCIGA